MWLLFKDGDVGKEGASGEKTDEEVDESVSVMRGVGMLDVEIARRYLERGDRCLFVCI